MIELKDRTLKPEDIAQLNKEGYNLDESKNSLYIIRFLWNNKLNQAYQPHPFQVAEELNEHLAKDAIGMPYIVGPNPNEHLAGKDAGLPNTAEALLKIQADYAIGPIEKVVKSDTNNFYGIIKVFPGYHDYILNEKEPPLVSPTFDAIEYQGQKLTKANFLNLNAINSGGYPVALTKIKGTCKNGIKQCMAELSVYAAAGNLRASREEQESFSSTILKNIKIMSNEESGSNTKTLENRVEDLESGLASVSKQVSAMSPKVDAIAEKILKDGGTDTNTDPAPASAAGPNQQLEKLDITKHPAFEKLNKEFNEMKKLSEKREKEIAVEQAKIREKQATSIVELINRGKKLTDDEKNTQIKNWVEKKDADDNLENLDLLESTLRAALPKEESDIASAAGPEGLFPGMNADFDPANKPKNSTIISKTIGRFN